MITLVLANNIGEDLGGTVVIHLKRRLWLLFSNYEDSFAIYSNNKIEDRTRH